MIAIDSWKHYHDSTIMAVTIMTQSYFDVLLHHQPLANKTFYHNSR